MRSSRASGVVRRVFKRKRALALVGAALACAAGAPAIVVPSPPPPPPPPPLTWTLVWSDDFSGAAGAAIDTTKWRYDTGDGCPGNCGWGNSEREFYTSDTANIAQNGLGQLAITARVATDTIPCYYGSCLYKSAKITTRGKMSVSPGRVEARIKLAAGQGLWPAFWLLGNNIGSVGWPTCGELDIMENKGSQPTSTSSAVHGPGYSGNTPFAHSYGPIVTTDYHIYAVEWDTQSIRYFVDGNQHYIVSRTNVSQYGNWVFDQPFFVILNLAVGGHFDGDPQSNAIFPATILVDYVRVYQKH